MLLGNGIGYVSHIPCKLRVGMVEFHPIVKGKPITTKKPVLDIRLALSYKEAGALARNRKLSADKRVLKLEPLDDSAPPPTFYDFREEAEKPGAGEEQTAVRQSAAELGGDASGHGHEESSAKERQALRLGSPGFLPRNCTWSEITSTAFRLPLPSCISYVRVCNLPSTATSLPFSTYLQVFSASLPNAAQLMKSHSVVPSLSGLRSIANVNIVTSTPPGVILNSGWRVVRPIKNAPVDVSYEAPPWPGRCSPSLPASASQLNPPFLA
jgi:hypothetical protein